MQKRLAMLGLLLAGLLPVQGRGGAEEGVSGMPDVPTTAEILRGCRFTWAPVPQLKDVQGVYPHPNCPDVVAAAAENGVWLSLDAGRVWTAVPDTAPAKIGKIRSIAFSMKSADYLYLGSEAKGVWRVEKGKAGVRQLGDKSRGMVSDSVCKIVLYPKGRGGDTLLVLHGEKAAGISRSENGGRTWQVIAPDYFVRDLIFSRSESERGDVGYSPWLVAASTREPKIVSLWSNQTVGDQWLEERRDIIEAEGAAGLLGKGTTFWATADKGLLRTAGSFNAMDRVGPDTVDEWAGVGVTRGPLSGTEVVYAYDPYDEGVLISADGMTTWVPRNEGLRLGKFVRTGSQVRASANGRTFYAVVNGSLQQARVEGENFGLREVRVAPESWVTPGSLLSEQLNRLNDCERAVTDTSKDLMATVRDLNGLLDEINKTAPIALTVSARLNPGASLTAVSVMVDASGLGSAPALALYDDGKHGDAAAGDGLFAGQVPLNLNNFLQGVPYRNSKNELKRTPPLNGPEELPVWAVGKDGATDRALAVLPVSALPGVIDVRLKDKDESDVPVQQGEWEERLSTAWGTVDITGCYAVSFLLRAEKPIRDEVMVRLRDHPSDTLPAETGQVALLRGNYLAGGKGEIPAEYIRVTIPLEKFQEEGSAFQPTLQSALVFSGRGTAANTLYVKKVAFYASEADLPEEEKK